MDKKNIADIYKLTPVQEGMLFHTLNNPDTGVYTEQFTRKVARINESLWERAWNQMLEKYSVLRTGMFWEGLDKPIQVVRKNVQVTQTVQDWSTLSEKHQKEKMISLLKEDHLAGFDFRKPPLMRQHIIHVSSTESYYVWTYHHVILDGWSAFVILDEVLEAYNALLLGFEKPIKSAVEFKQYIRWLSQQDTSQAEEFWRNYLNDFTSPTELKFVELPTFKSDINDQDYNIIRIELESRLVEKLREFAKTSRLTLNTLFQGAWGLLLSIYSGENDVVFGSTVSGRPVDLPGAESMVGLFINTLPTRVTINSHETIIEWLRQLQNKQLEVRQHEYSSLVDIHRCSGIARGVTLFNSMLAVESFPSSKHMELPDIEVAQKTNYPITLVVEPASVIRIKVMYNASQYSNATIERILKQLTHTLSYLVDNGDNYLTNISLVDKKEKEILEKWNGGTNSYPKEYSLSAMFEKEVSRVPENIAVYTETKQCTYSELNESSNLLAGYLKTQGIRPGSDVAMIFEPSVDMIVAIVAIVKLGCAYVPLDPGLPQERLDNMISDLGIRHLVTHRGVHTRFLNKEIAIFNIDNIDDEIPNISTENILENINTRNLLYIIHTSGSTGKPKAAGVFHYSFINFITWWNEEFGFKESDKVLLVNKVTFDLSQKNIWGALLTGGQLHLSIESHYNPATVISHIEKQGITWMNCTPSMAYALVENDESDYSALSSLQYLFLGGEPVDKRRLQKWMLSDHFRGELVNTYGPTECTDLCTVHRFNRSEFSSLETPVTVGKVLPNIKIYVIDRFNNRLPRGICGEVMIGGESVGCGYLNNAAMTSDKFIPDEFSKNGGNRIYRTGDIGYFQQDGSVVVKGRVDFQVKIRGYRIELEEIDAVIRQTESIADSVTVVSTDGNQQLISYVVLKDPDIQSDKLRSDIKEYIAGKLPEYMVPSVFVVLEKIPLNENGKVNRSALPTPQESDRASTEKYIAPRDEIEEKLSQIWKSVLQVDNLSVTDNFFELGGHSLSITQVFSRIPKVFKVQVPLSELFNKPTIAEQSESIRSLNKQKLDLHATGTGSIRTVERPDIIPLSFAQSRLWFLNRYDSKNLSYNVPNAIMFDKAINYDRLSKTLDFIADRHETLRTRFPVLNGVPHQLISKKAAVDLRLIDLTHFSESEKNEKISEIAKAEASILFDLEEGRLARYVLVRTDANSSILFTTMHHIITDGWSMDMFTNELRTVYDAFERENEPELSPIKIQYADYALWQRGYLQGEILDRLVTYWRGVLVDSAATVDLPYDYGRPAQLSYQGGIVRNELSGELARNLQKLAEMHGATLYMCLYSVFAVLLYRSSGQNDFNVGTPIANRHREEIENTMGFFVNTLVLRTKIEGSQSFSSLVSQVKSHAQSAYDHQELPFELLVDQLQSNRSASLNPFFQVMFALQTAYEDTSLINSEDWVSRFDLQVTFSKNEEGLEGQWEFNRALFKKETIIRLSKQFIIIAQKIIDNCEIPINEISLVDDHDALNEIHLWNDSIKDYPRSKYINELFEETEAKYPDKKALICENKEVSYSNLNMLANRLANFLKLSLGVPQGARVGISITRSADQIAAILAVLKVGAVYVPLDPTYPDSRLRFMAEDSGVSLILTTQSTHSRWSDISSNTLCIDDESTLIELQNQSAGNLNITMTEDTSARLAYVVYTSGTTGNPKGVQIPHRAVTRLVRDTNYCPLNSETIMLQVAPVAFDASTFEIWGALLNGGCLVIFASGFVDMKEVSTLIRERNVNTAFLTTGLFNAWMAEHKTGRTGLKYLFSGGEIMSRQAVSKLFECDPDIKFFNVYGPTENTTFSSYFPISRSLDLSRPVPIGKPISNTQLYVLDTLRKPVPIGVIGELYTAGDGLAIGYHNRPDLNAEKFEEISLTPNARIRMYKTGDLVRRLPDGNIEFIGRTDTQVKIRGFRIEIEEIRHTIERHPDVISAAIYVIDDEHKGKQLVAYYKGRNGEVLRASDLRSYLQTKLPDYMIPSYVMSVEEFPLNENGKIDAKRLPSPNASEQRGTEVVPPESQIEMDIWKIWSDLLQMENFGVEDNFFTIGGHSLLAAQVVTRINEKYNTQIPLKDFFISPRIKDISHYVEVTSYFSHSVEKLRVEMETDEAGCI